jgi:membrane protein
MFADLNLPDRWSELAKQTVAEINRDNVLGLAAQLAFYFFLALFPALLFLVALLGYLPIDNLLAELLAALGSVAPDDAVALLRRQLDQLANGGSGGLVTIGIGGAVWSSSAAMVAIIDALNRAYDVEEWRSWWKRRGLAVLLTLALALFIVLAMLLVLAGPDVAGWLARRAGFGPAFDSAWRVARWPLMIFLIVLGVDLVYHFAPNRRRAWAWLTPGSLLATALWLASSFGFKFYVSRFGSYNVAYGAIGGVIVLLLWFYVSAFAILVGAEINGLIERRRRTTPGPGPS